MLNFPIKRQAAGLKIGVLLLRPKQPVWVSHVLAMISGLSFAKIFMLVPEDPKSVEFAKSVRSDSKKIFTIVFGWMDQILHGRKVIQGGERSIDPVRFSKEVITIPVAIRQARVSFSEPESIINYENLDLDLVLYFDILSLDNKFCEIPRYGLWNLAVHFLEWRIPEKVLDFLYDLHRSGRDWLSHDPYTMVLGLKTNWTEKYPSGMQLARIFAGVLFNKIITRLKEGIFKERWEIAYRFSDESILKEQTLHPLKRIKPPLRKIYGDPFPLEYEGRYFLFFEEMVVDERTYKLNGHISVLEIDPREGPSGTVRRVLERNYHLSYPFIFTWKGEFFMLPETHQNRSIELYRCVSFPDEWEFCQTLVKDIRAVDVTVFEKEGIWWMFAAVPRVASDSPDGIVAPHTYALNIFHAKSPLDVWEPHPQNPVKVDRTSVRGAGKIFFQDGYYYRPAQDCTPRYGHAVVFNRIEKWTTTEYLESEGFMIHPPDDWRILGVHTFNACGAFQTIDFIGYRNRFLP